MHLAYEYGVKNIWIVNVGDLKPMEFPISFFLDYAWNTNKWNENNLQDYYTQWAAKQFGNTYANEIGDILRKYSQYASRRKPELLDENTYSLENYNEADKIVKEWTDLEKQAEKIDQSMSSEYKDTYLELVLHPIKAHANLNELYYNAALNKAAYKNKYSIANEYADEVKKLYANDSLITLQYHRLRNGKWNHMMDQTHIGYTYWQQPSNNKMPEVKYVPKDSIIEFPGYDPFGSYNSSEGQIAKNIKGNFFYELDGYVSIEPAHYTKEIDANNIKWKVIPGIGKDGDGITTFPVTSNEQTIGNNSPHLEYEIYTYDSGSVKLQVYFSPSLNFHNDAEGLRYGISIDDKQPQVISINKDDKDQKTWEQWVANNIIIKTSNHTISEPGKHTIKYWMISPAVVLQKIVADFGGVKQSYLGPPETIYKHN